MPGGGSSFAMGEFSDEREGSVPPSNDDGDVAGHAAGEVYDLVADAVASRFQVIVPELKDFLGYSGERILPARLLLIDGAALVGAERVREAIDLDFAEAVSHRTLDHRRGELDLFVLGEIRGLAEPFDQGGLFRLDGGLPARKLVGFVRFLEGRLLLDVLCCW